MYAKYSQKCNMHINRDVFMEIAVNSQENKKNKL